MSRKTCTTNADASSYSKARGSTEWFDVWIISLAFTVARPQPSRPPMGDVCQTALFTSIIKTPNEGLSFGKIVFIVWLELHRICAKQNWWLLLEVLHLTKTFNVGLSIHTQTYQCTHTHTDILTHACASSQKNILTDWCKQQKHLR